MDEVEVEVEAEVGTEGGRSGEVSFILRTRFAFDECALFLLWWCWLSCFRSPVYALYRDGVRRVVLLAFFGTPARQSPHPLRFTCITEEHEELNAQPLHLK